MNWLQRLRPNRLFYRWGGGYHMHEAKVVRITDIGDSGVRIELAPPRTRRYKTLPLDVFDWRVGKRGGHAILVSEEPSLITLEGYET